MDPAAIAELTVEMWSLIDAKLIARKYTDLEPEVKAMMLDKAMSVYITNLIKEQKYSPKPTADKPADADHCAKCGRQLSVGELQFLEGKMGENRICYHCSH